MNSGSFSSLGYGKKIFCHFFHNIIITSLRICHLTQTALPHDAQDGPKYNLKIFTNKAERRSDTAIQLKQKVELKR
jgi:hypothetical protein